MSSKGQLISKGLFGIHNSSKKKTDVFDLTKGQKISKGLFDILKFSQKTNKQIRFSSKKEFVCLFFWENSRISKSPFEII